MCLCKYIVHLKKIIDLPEGDADLEWVDVASEEPHLLSFDSLDTLGYDFRGTVDVLLRDKKARACLEPMLGMYLLLDLSKEVSKCNIALMSSKPKQSCYWPICASLKGDRCW